MSVQTLADVIADLRNDVSDRKDENLVIDESLGGVQNNSNKRFTCANQPVADAATFELRRTVAGTTTLLVVTTDFTLDRRTGIVTLVSAPADEDTKLLATYFWVAFDDDDYYQFISSGAEFVGSTVATAGLNPSQRAAAELLLVPEGLLAALKKFGEHQYWHRRASRWAQKFSSSTAGQSTSGIDNVSNKFLQLSQDAFKMANQLRNDHYEGFSKRQYPGAQASGPPTGIGGRYDPRR